ncbi:MAG: 2-dehydro-3-deoxy-D-gluconate 5-dehydrogenase @ 2-deoxy-D-gluconate 3-dehydrogenase, partial [uncultured Rubrobacteraceae bacterium]
GRPRRPRARRQGRPGHRGGPRPRGRHGARPGRGRRGRGRPGHRPDGGDRGRSYRHGPAFSRHEPEPHGDEGGRRRRDRGPLRLGDGPSGRPREQRGHHPPRFGPGVRGGGLGGRHPGEPLGGLLPLPGRRAALRRAGGRREDNQHRLGPLLRGRHHRPLLRGLQSRHSEPHARARQRVGAPRYKRERPRAELLHDRADRGHQGERGALHGTVSPHTCGPLRGARRPQGRGGPASLGSGGLHPRLGPARRRRLAGTV